MNIEQIIARQEEEFDKLGDYNQTEDGDEYLHPTNKEILALHRSSIKEILEGVKQHYSELKQNWVDDMPKGKCINAEMRMFGRCFDCERNQGKQEAMQDTINHLSEIIKKL